MFTAEMAREEVAKNEERNKLINKFIKETEDNIKNACKRGERYTLIRDREHYWGKPYIEVLEHFKELGYNVKQYSDGSGYYLTW